MSNPDKTAEFVEMLEQHKALIHKISNSYAFTRQDREDLFQDIVLQLWRSFERYDDNYRHSTWIYRIALNVSITAARKKRRYKQNLDKNAGSFKDESTDTIEQDQHEQLYELISTLNEFERAVIILYLENRSHEEISEIMGISKTNVATKIGRLKQKLQKQHSRKR